MKPKYNRQYKPSTIFLIKKLRDICAEVNQIPTFLAFDPKYRDRATKCVLSRQMFCSILYSSKLKTDNLFNLTDIGILVFYPDVSELFDHSLVLHSIKTINNLIETNTMFKRNYYIARDKFNELVSDTTDINAIKASNVDYWIKLSSLKESRLKTNRQYIVT